MCRKKKGISAYDMSFAVPCNAVVLYMTYDFQSKGDYKKLTEDVGNQFCFFCGRDSYSNGCSCAGFLVQKVVLCIDSLKCSRQKLSEKIMRQLGTYAMRKARKGGITNY